MFDVWEHLFLDENRGLTAIYDLPKEKLEVVGKELWEKFAYIRATPERSWQTIEKEYWADFLAKFESEFSGRQIPSIEQLIEFSKKFIKPVNEPDTLLLLERLAARKIALAICSNNNEFWFARQMEVSGFEKFFLPQNIMLSCRIGVSKSHPSGAMFKGILDMLGLPSEKTLFVDDRQSNVDKAREFGIHSVLFPSENVDGIREFEKALLSYL